MLVFYSFLQRDGLGRIVFEFSWENYLRAFDWRFLKILLYSVWYAFLTTIICMAVGYPAAYFIGRAPERVRSSPDHLRNDPLLDEFPHPDLRLDLHSQQQRHSQRKR